MYLGEMIPACRSQDWYKSELSPDGVHRIYLATFTAPLTILRVYTAQPLDKCGVRGIG